MSASSDPRAELGRTGEDIAERFLRARGFKTIARRFATPVGELDLIMRDGDTVVFVEVKTRSTANLAQPRDAVHGGKQRRMTRAARWFLQRQQCTDRPCRFDVVAITLPAGGEPQVDYVPDAFGPTDAG